MAFAERVIRLKQEGAYEVLARAQELERDGREIIHLEIGEPDFATAPHISMAGVKAIVEGRTRYNPSAGIHELRAALADDAGRRRGMTVLPDQVVVGPGAKPLLFFPMLALVEPGDEVLCPDPGFPTYEAVIRLAGGVPVSVPLVEENDFSFDLDAFHRLITRRTKVVLLNSPSNPTGGVMPREDLERIAEVAIERGLWVISDEVYSRIAYDGRQVPSIAAFPGMQERTVIVDGFSKTYAMTGWRLGYGILPETLAARVQLLLTHSVGCTAHMTQYAGLEAVHGPQEWVEGMVAIYQRRRDRLVAGLNAIPGIRCKTPQGAFYAFPNVSALNRPVSDLASQILEEAGVALLPGTAFGPAGEGYLRISYANSLERIEQGLTRLEAFFRRLK